MRPTGAYDAERAAALSGVPLSTVYYWARRDILVPSVSASKVQLWSYADLMALRTIYWLRQRKTDEAGAAVPPTSMKAIRKALRRLRSLDEEVSHPDQTSIWVDDDGAILVRGPAGPETLDGQTLVATTINLIAPFTTREGLRGPDLARPRPGLRIVPGRLSGAPHVVDTRLESRALAALARDGLDLEAIHRLYPFVSVEQIGDAIDLETQLAKNLNVSVAA